MRPWKERSFEHANLLNPAFCSILLHNAIKGYEKDKDGSMPYPLLFIVLPIVLHSSTRENLPKKITTKVISDKEGTIFTIENVILLKG